MCWELFWFLRKLLIGTGFLVVCLLGSDWPDSSSLGSCVMKTLKPPGKRKLPFSLPLSTLPPTPPPARPALHTQQPNPPLPSKIQSVPTSNVEASMLRPSFVPRLRHAGIQSAASHTERWILHPRFWQGPRDPTFSQRRPRSNYQIHLPGALPPNTRAHRHTDSRTHTAFSLLSLHQRLFHSAKSGGGVGGKAKCLPTTEQRWRCPYNTDQRSFLFFFLLLLLSRMPKRSWKTRGHRSLVFCSMESGQNPPTAKQSVLSCPS